MEPKYRKYKTARRAVVKAKEMTYTKYTIQCPFCKTVCESNWSRDVVRIRCFRCGNEIILDYDK